VQNAVSNTAGIIAPIATGQMVLASGHYALALWVTGGVAMVGVVAWLAIVPRAQPIRWSRSGAGREAPGLV
jgi:hypothetical protein